MKYVIKTIQGVVEIRRDMRTELPQGAKELTDEEYDKMCAGLLVFSDGDIIVNPTPLIPGVIR